MDSRIRIKVGAIEVDFEGSEEYLKTGLIALLETVSHLFDSSSEGEAELENSDIDGVEIEEVEDTSSNNGAKEDLAKLSMATFAKRLKISTGPELVLAAILHLALSEGNQAPTRRDILNEIKKAIGFYNENHSKNLTRYLQKLTGDKINGLAGKKFSLKATTKAELEKKLAE